jgi:hypothetical protein
MFENEIIEFCIRHKINVNQYFFLWLLLNKDWNRPYKESLGRQYLNEVDKFTQRDIDDLENKGMIGNLNYPPNTLPEMYIVKDHISKEIFVSEDEGEELWNAYPPNFPLSSGGTFIARAGGDKDDLIEKYLKKINFSPVKHRFVMQQLKNYKSLVQQGRINGHKISDFIGMELWTTIAEISTKEIKEKGGTFGRNI